MNTSHSMVSGGRDRVFSPGEPYPECTHEQLLFRYLDRLGDGIVLIDQDQTVVWMNRCMERLFCLDRIDTLGMNAIDFVALCIAPRLELGEAFKEKIIAASLFGEEIQSVRVYITNQNAPVLPIEYSSLQLFGSSPRYARCDEYRIIPGREPPGEALRKNERRSPFLAADCGDMVCTLDAEMRITTVSLSLRHLLGYQPSEIAGSPFERILMPESIDDCRSLGAICSGDDAADEGSALSFLSMPLVYRRRDGSPMQLDTRILVPAGASGALLHIAHSNPGGDGDEVRRRIDENIEQFATLADRIRNPLAAIVGLADLAGGEASEKIIRQALAIDAVITDLDRGWLASMKVREFLRKHDRSGGSM